MIPFPKTKRSHTLSSVVQAARLANAQNGMSDTRGDDDKHLSSQGPLAKI